LNDLHRATGAIRPHGEDSAKRHLFTLGSKKVGYLETKQMVIPCHAGSILNI
jgi:hypothetical protein